MKIEKRDITSGQTLMENRKKEKKENETDSEYIHSLWTSDACKNMCRAKGRMYRNEYRTYRTQVQRNKLCVAKVHRNFLSPPTACVSPDYFSFQRRKCSVINLPQKLWFQWNQQHVSLLSVCLWFRPFSPRSYPSWHINERDEEEKWAKIDIFFECSVCSLLAFHLLIRELPERLHTESHIIYWRFQTRMDISFFFPILPQGIRS